MALSPVQTSETLAFGSNVTGSNSLICSMSSNGGPASGITDTAGNTWVFISGSQVGNGVDDMEIWWVETAIAGATTLTVAGGVSQGINISEWPPLASAGTPNTFSIGTGTVTSAAISATNVGDLLIAAANLNDFFVSGPTGSWTSVGIAGSNSRPVVVAYLVAPNTSTQTTTWTANSDGFAVGSSVAFSVASTGSTQGLMPIIIGAF